MLQIEIYKLVKSAIFEKIIISLILLNALILGLETDPDLVSKYGYWFELAHQFILMSFIIEAMLKISAVVPRLKLYFGDGWNLFDFSVIVLSLIPATGELAMVARLARLLRVLRLISTLPKLRLIVSTLMRSIPSMGHVMLLMSIIFYVYAIAGYHLFHTHDPQHWGHLGVAALTLFRVVTLEDWTDVMYTAMEHYEWAWVYFISFIFVGTFVIVNLFIAVVLNNLEEAKVEQLEKLRQPISHDEMLKELAETQKMLIKLRERMERVD
ncbi:MAG: ion transporter [endosymbiont of Galathealinum brachiosum]|uniref:Ion transporter n=1 Tax=endosymbiont of Galathealinum brachiosum TaxID=2200906 RepID=A0A370DMW3_9GAMM|nr:MAG: ion transporter [endosymbiont of Galathealinum brachiosum]